MAQATRPLSATDIGRMQQEAMARMMEMQRGSREHSGGWSTDPNVPRQNRAPRREESDPLPQPPRPSAPPPREEPRATGRKGSSPQHRNSQWQGQPGPGRRPQPPPPEPREQSDTTLLQDILNAVGLDDDRVLILGLILILINSKADTTLILALCYLLL